MEVVTFLTKIQKSEGNSTTLKNWIQKMEGNSTTPKNCVLTEFLHERSTIFFLVFSLIRFWILLRNACCSAKTSHNRVSTNSTQQTTSYKLNVLIYILWHGISRRILDSRIEIVVCGVPGNSIMMRCIKVDMNTFGAPGCKIWLKEEFINFKCINKSFILDNFK